ncbi:MAG TPA: glycoside hydrolase family 18 protein [Chryseosolibacter sp.]|nr:glycoside hydrolase family 18 protein [Chryseosolibacter sp.]
MVRRLFFILAILLSVAEISAQSREFNIIAYYAGGPERVDSLPAEKLTHIIYSFCHLKGNRLQFDAAADSTAVTKLVGLKQRNPKLKIILSLGGWGGCETCSDVFSTAEGREEFAASTLALNERFKCDGIDLDWEYPAIEGYPGHKFVPADRENFTALIKELRKTLGVQYEISFAAGGFRKFLEESVEWEKIINDVDRINLMSYDLINGYSEVTGHHTALFSTPLQRESAHQAIRYLLKKGVPRSKIVIGAAFYARVWEDVAAFNDGLYQQGKFKTSINYQQFPAMISPEAGFEFFWDETAMAPYAYNPKKKLFATFDDKKSIEQKTLYVIDQKLDGIMFWEISHDTLRGGLVDTIYDLKTSNGRRRK